MVASEAGLGAGDGHLWMAKRAMASGFVDDMLVLFQETGSSK